MNLILTLSIQKQTCRTAQLEEFRKAALHREKGQGVKKTLELNATSDMKLICYKLLAGVRFL